MERIGHAIGQFYDLFRAFELKSVEMKSLTDKGVVFVITDMEGDSHTIEVNITRSVK